MADSLASTRAAHSRTSTPIVQRYKASLVEVLIGGVAVHVLLHLGKVWFRLLDLNRLFDYTSPRTSAIRNALERRGHDFMNGILRVSEGRNSAVFISEDQARLICQINVGERTKALSDWINGGGIERLKDADPAHAAPPPTRQRPELIAEGDHRKAYCRELTRIIVRYAEPTEVEQFAQLLENAARGITHRRPCQGLNDAAYAAFTRYTFS